MDCCHCKGADALFDSREASQRMANYRRHGPVRTTRLLLDALLERGIAGMDLLDIGGGVGVIQHELARAGAARIVDVDASSAYIAVARAESVRQGYSDRATYMHGDFVALAPQIAPADIVTLDRVICCYPDMPALVAASAARARRFYGLVLPRDARWVAMGMRIINLGLRLQGSAFRIFCHPIAAVDAIARREGLNLRLRRGTALWQVLLYERV